METLTSNTEISLSIIVIIFVIAVLAIASVLLTLVGICYCIGYRRKIITLISKNDLQEYSDRNEDETEAYEVTTTSNGAYQGHEEVKDSLIDSEHMMLKQNGMLRMKNVHCGMKTNGVLENWKRI